ncbi:MAG: MFS transporter [Akkermansia sp.]|nr:MFS transporter [Akkermansia sp.]
MADEEEDFYKEPTRKEWTGFWTLVAVQAQNAFNEKAVQFLLIPLGVWLWQASGSTLEYILGAIFVLPYILFSPLSGWISDCFCKTRIVQVMSALQIIIMSCMLFCFCQRDMEASIMWFAIFAIQATILSPAKKGIVKDLLGSKYIGFGSGIIEMSLVFVLLLAQIGVFFLFSYLMSYFEQKPEQFFADIPFISGKGIAPGEYKEQLLGWLTVILPTAGFIILACLVLAASFLLPSYPAKQHRPFSWSLFYEHFGQIKYLWKDRLLRLSELGIAYFWCLAGSLFLILIQIAKGMQAADPNVDFSLECGILMAWMTGGVVLGGVVASQLCKGKNELGLIPFGAIGITVCTLLLTIFDVNTYISNTLLALTGAFGAAYLVPLNAFLQDNCDPSNRGNIIAAGNLIDNLMGLFAVALMWVMHEVFHASPQQQFFVLFVMSFFILICSLRLIPQEFIRMIGIWCLQLVYRPRTINLERLPMRGGALLVVNHVTYADALFLTMVCPRTVRFIVAEEFMAMRLLGWALEIFNSLPISTRNPRETIIKAARAIENGDIICIFPEGQLTRSGCLTPIRRGMEMIARRAKAPIIPVYMDGLWGSIFSFSRNRFFTKLPKTLNYNFTVAFGAPLDPDTFTSRTVLRAFRELSATCLETAEDISREGLIRMLEERGTKSLVFYPGGSLTAIQIAAALISRQADEQFPPLARKWLQLLIDGTEDLLALHRYWLNVCQVRRVNALKEGRHHLLTTVGHGEPQELVLAVLWPLITRTPVHLIESPQETLDTAISQIVGGAHMRRILLTTIPPRQIPFYDFSGAPAISTPNMRWRPCLCTPMGNIISMSMCHSVFKMSDGTIQLGVRPRTRGLLLPGYRVETPAEGSTAIISAPSLRTEYTLPSHIYLDESGFLAELS